jgi:hypothetical protein
MREDAHDPEVLIQHYLEDCLTEAEAAALLEMTQRDPALAQRLMEQLHLDAMLREATAGLGSLAPAVNIVKPTPRKSIWLPTTMAAALAACVTLAGTWLAGFTTDDEATTSAVAVLMRGVNAEWEGTAPPTGAGSAEAEERAGADRVLSGSARDAGRSGELRTHLRERGALHFWQTQRPCAASGPWV